MGLKDAAKKLMDAAGVPITPGYHGKDQSPKLLKAKAGMIGYPVLIKAVAGGGGKGMRKVEAEADFDAALASCKREAASSFGNEDVLIEKYIQRPRHIEVQVFGDTHGNVVHMFERDCSLQRRHQKVIEEEIKMSGHAVEARLYAEDPTNDFLPSVGRIEHLDNQSHRGRNSGVRIETGFTAISEIGIYYDPMIAKIIGYGRDRGEAIGKLHDGLHDIHVHPIITNAHTLYKAIDSDDFWDEKLSTDFFEKNSALLKPYDIRQDDRAYAILALKEIEQGSYCNEDCVDASIEHFNLRDGWRLNQPNSSVFRYKRGDGECIVEINDRRSNYATVTVDGQRYSFSFDKNNRPTTLKDALDNPHKWGYYDKDYLYLCYRSAYFYFERANEDGTDIDRPA